MKLKDREALLAQFKRSRKFVDGKSTYVAEYHAWKSLPKPFLPLLLGVYELPIDEYRNGAWNDNLTSVGYPNLRVINYDIGSDDYYDSSTKADVTGCTCVARTPEGEIRSAIFIRQEVFGTERVPADKLEETIAHNKLGVLLHEIGHAWDVEMQFHYDHSKPSFDGIKGEFFAHKFSFQLAVDCDYREVNKGIADRMKDDAASGRPIYSEAAQMMLRCIRPKRVGFGV